MTMYTAIILELVEVMLSPLFFLVWYKLYSYSSFLQVAAQNLNFKQISGWKIKECFSEFVFYLHGGGCNMSQGPKCMCDIVLEISQLEKSPKFFL